jgi:hypothetical protein
LNDEDTLQNASIDKRNSEERLIGIFAGLAKVLKARMVLRLLDGYQT